MRFYKKRNQAAKIWDPKKGKDGGVIIEFTKQPRDEYGIDGFYDTKKKSEIKVLEEMGYRGEEIPEEAPPEEPITSRNIDSEV